MVKNRQTSICFFLLYLVPAIPFETLSQLQESAVLNDSLDYFQSVEVENAQIIQEIVYNSPTEKSTQTFSNNETIDLDNIPDMEDFENQNLLIAEDPVKLVYLSIYSLIRQLILNPIIK